MIATNGVVGNASDRRHVSGMTFDEERALYNLRDAVVENCTFSGPNDGESALKESRDIVVRGCTFDLRYPVWHTHEFTMEGCRLTENCRAPLWYSSDGILSDTVVSGVKCLRECDDIAVRGCRIGSPEFGWKCRGIKI